MLCNLCYECVCVCAIYVCVCACVFFPFILDIKFSGRTSRGVTQEEGHTGFLIHLLSAVRALIFLARRIQPFFPSSAVKSNFVY